MGVVIVDEKVAPEDLVIAQEEYGEYVKIVIDIETEAMAIGGEWHADAEKELLEAGSKQSNMWGGGIDLTSKRIETIALINIRPRLGNDSQEIIDPKIRQRFVTIARKKFCL